MRRKDREILDLDKIESIIAGARYMHLGMFDENYPYVVPLHYGYEMKDGKLTFYVHGAKEGHKLDCLRKNDHVFVEIGEEHRISEKMADAVTVIKVDVESYTAKARVR